MSLRYGSDERCLRTISKQKHQRERNETTGAKGANLHAAENQVQLTVNLPYSWSL